MATMKSNQVVRVTVEGNTITFAVAGAGETVLHTDRIHPDNQVKAMFHGFKQRISDAAAQSRDPATGNSASPAEKLAAMVRLVEHYESGSAEWATRVRADGDRMTLLGEALAELRPDRTREQVRAFITGLSKAQRTALELRADVKAIMDRLAGERTQGVDTDELLEAF